MYHEIPRGKHGQRKNPEIEAGYIRGLVNFFKIPNSCYQKYVDLH